MNPTELNELLHYIDSLRGTLYKWWLEGETGEGGPFYAADEPLPTPANIRAQGLNCAGFINLLRRFRKYPIPGVKEGLWNAGGTYVWFRSLQAEGLLEPFNPSFPYPPGTLLLRDYTSVFDQGHLAVVLHNNQIAHCYPDDPIPRANVFVEPGLRIEPLALSMNWDSKGFYTHICRPENWITRKLEAQPCKTMSQIE